MTSGSVFPTDIPPLDPATYDGSTAPLSTGTGVFRTEVDLGSGVARSIELTAGEVTELQALAALVAPAEAREAAKQSRAKAVASIVVTTSTGKAFDGDETSQGRMSRALLAMQLAGVTETLWILADNTPTQVTLAELGEALILAGQEQTRLWVI